MINVIVLVCKSYSTNTLQNDQSYGNQYINKQESKVNTHVKAAFRLKSDSHKDEGIDFQWRLVNVKEQGHPLRVLVLKKVAKFHQQNTQA